MSNPKWLVALALTVTALLAADATPSEKVRICHATASESNPYTSNTVDTSSVDEINNQYLNGHGDHVNDIIPPFTSPDGTEFPGLNWDEEGQEIWNNGCETPTTSTTSSTSSTTTSTTSVVSTTTTPSRSITTTTSTVPSSTTTTAQPAPVATSDEAPVRTTG